MLQHQGKNEEGWRAGGGKASRRRGSGTSKGGVRGGEGGGMGRKNSMGGKQETSWVLHVSLAPFLFRFLTDAQLDHALLFLLTLLL